MKKFRRQWMNKDSEYPTGHLANVISLGYDGTCLRIFLILNLGGNA